MAKRLVSRLHHGVKHQAMHILLNNFLGVKNFYQKLFAIKKLVKKGGGWLLERPDRPNNGQVMAR